MGPQTTTKMGHCPLSDARTLRTRGLGAVSLVLLLVAGAASPSAPQPTCIDVLTHAQIKTAKDFTLDMAVDFLPLMQSLLASRFEDYIVVALEGYCLLSWRHKFTTTKGTIKIVDAIVTTLPISSSSSTCCSVNTNPPWLLFRWWFFTGKLVISNSILYVCPL